MKKLLCFLGGALLLSNVANAQYNWQKFESDKIYIDNHLPDFSLGKFIRYKDTRAKLSNFYNKIVILDFWFTHCTACIKEFPIEDSLQKEFGDDIQIIPVAYESAETVDSFLNHWEALHNTKLSLPFIVGDSVLNKLFYNPYCPHYVWIAQDRRVIGLTSESFITRENIRGMIEQSKRLKERIAADSTFIRTSGNVDIEQILKTIQNTPSE